MSSKSEIKSQSQESSLQVLETEEIDQSIFHDNYADDESQDIKNLSKSLIQTKKQDIKQKGKQNNKDKDKSNDYEKILQNIDQYDEKHQIIEPHEIKNKNIHNKQKRHLGNLDQSIISIKSQQSQLNKSFAKIKHSQISCQIISTPHISQYMFSINIGKVLVQLLEVNPEIMNELFDCIVLPCSDIPFNMSPLSQMRLQKRVTDKSISVQSTVIDQTKKGKLGISDTLFLNDSWFKSTQSRWKSGIFVRVPKGGQFDDKLLLFKSMFKIVNTFQSNSQNLSLKSMVIPWLADSQFNINQGAQLMIQGLLKALIDINQKQINRIAICTINKQQLNSLKSNLRKKLMILLTK